MVPMCNVRRNPGIALASSAVKVSHSRVISLMWLAAPTTVFIASLTRAARALSSATSALSSFRNKGYFRMRWTGLIRQDCIEVDCSPDGLRDSAHFCSSGCDVITCMSEIIKVQDRERRRVVRAVLDVETETVLRAGNDGTHRIDRLQQRGRGRGVDHGARVVGPDARERRGRGAEDRSLEKVQEVRLRGDDAPEVA
eukprot:m.95456 g.95456  ORF g.95456 m.95456 type:complete len:197 (+) comp8601_c0_seq1:445-1035(+)